MSIRRESESTRADVDLKFPLLGERRFQAYSTPPSEADLVRGASFGSVSFTDSRGGDGLNFVSSEIPPEFSLQGQWSVLSPLDLPFSLIEAWRLYGSAYCGLFAMKRALQYALVLPVVGERPHSSDEQELKIVVGRLEPSDLEPGGWVSRFRDRPESYREIALEVDRKRGRAASQVPPIQLWVDRRSGEPLGMGLQLPMIGSIRLDRVT